MNSLDAGQFLDARTQDWRPLVRVGQPRTPAVADCERLVQVVAECIASRRESDIPAQTARDFRCYSSPDVYSAEALKTVLNGTRVTIAGAVICRQRPGTAKGFVFISLEGETGIANAVVIPQLFERHRLVFTQEPALKIAGRVQNVSGVIHVRAGRIEPLRESALPAQASRDFRESAAAANSGSRAFPPVVPAGTIHPPARPPA